MRSHPESVPATPVPLPVPRGVHSYVEHPSGQTVYFATMSTGELLNGEMRRRFPDETDAMVLDEMQKDLDRQDPVGAVVTARPRLSVSSGGQSPRRDRRGPSRPA